MSITTSSWDYFPALARRVGNSEIVPGLAIPEPKFSTVWNDWQATPGGIEPPDDFLRFVRGVGAIDAMDVAGGLSFYSPEEVQSLLSQMPIGTLLSNVSGVSCFPFAVNGSGSYLLLAEDDTGVWKFNAHMHPVARPILVSSGFAGFVELVRLDWEAVCRGEGGPYSTS